MSNDAGNQSLNPQVVVPELVKAFERRRVRYALIGGLALGYRSQPRFTKDVDVLLEVPQVVLPGLLEELRGRGFVFDLEETIRQWVREHMTVLSFQGTRIDWLKPVLPCYQHIIEQATPETWLNCETRIASAEGLILMKLLAFRGQDQVDIENLLAANQGALDLDWVRHEWATVADRDDERLRWFESKAAE